MSNDLIVSIQNQMAALQTGVDEDTRAVAGAGGSKRISIKGGVFRKIAGGKEIGSIEDRHMNVIFVKMAHTPSRKYYSAAFKEGAKVSPICWSTDAKVPDADVKHPPATACDKCQWSVKGTGNNGQGTACRIAWRTAIVLPADPGGDVMQLEIPAASVFGQEEAGKWPFRAYVQMLANNNISAGKVVTRMAFDTKFSAPRVLFSPVSAIDPADSDTLLMQGKTNAAEMAIKLTVFQTDTADDEVVDDEPAPAAAPVADAEVQVVGVKAEGIPEPTLRATSAPVEKASPDVSAVLQKWATKK